MATTNQMKSLDHVKQVMRGLETLIEQQKESLAGMGALQPFATAIIKLAEEIEAIKDQQAGRHEHVIGGDPGDVQFGG